MLDFLQITVLVLAFMTSLTSFTSIGKPATRVFSCFLGFSVAMEFAALYHAKVLHQPNAYLYNVSAFVIFPFFGFFYGKFLTGASMKLVAKVLTVLWLIFSTVNIAIIQGPLIWNSYSILLGCIQIVILSVAYLIQLLRNPEMVTPGKDPVVWISCGLLLFYLVNIPYITLMNYLNLNFPPLAQQLLVILKLLYISMYSLFIISFLCTINIRKS